MFDNQAAQNYIKDFWRYCRLAPSKLSPFDATLKPDITEVRERIAKTSALQERREFIGRCISGCLMAAGTAYTAFKRFSRIRTRQ